MQTRPKSICGEISGKLIAAPVAQIDEAPASWIQYVCASHQYSITRLERILGIRPRFHDWDLLVSRQDWANVFQRADCSNEAFAEAFLSTEYSIHTSKRKSLAGFKDGPPKYRWCSSCLQEDARPYIRWWWRFPNRTHCPKHQQKLVRKCFNCQSELILSYALMVNAGSRFPIPDLSYCQQCSLPLFFSVFAEHTGLDDLDSEPQRPISPPKYTLKAPQKIRWGKNRFLAYDTSLVVGPFGIGKRPTLLVNATSFQDHPFVNFSANRGNWSSRISRHRYAVRDKVAYALRLIRSEKKLLET